MRFKCWRAGCFNEALKGEVYCSEKCRNGKDEKVFYNSSNRNKVCRMCYKEIPKNEKCIEMSNIQVADHVGSLFFHINCFNNIVNEFTDLHS